MKALQPTKLGVGLTNRGHEWVSRQKVLQLDKHGIRLTNRRKFPNGLEATAHISLNNEKSPCSILKVRSEEGSESFEKTLEFLVGSSARPNFETGE